MFVFTLNMLTDATSTPSQFKYTLTHTFGQCTKKKRRSPSFLAPYSCVCVWCIEWRWIMTKVHSLLLDSLEMSMCTHLALSMSVCIFTNRFKFCKQIDYSASVFLVFSGWCYFYFILLKFICFLWRRFVVSTDLCKWLMACQTFCDSYENGYVKSVDSAMYIFNSIQNLLFIHFDVYFGCVCVRVIVQKRTMQYIHTTKTLWKIMSRYERENEWNRMKWKDREGAREMQNVLLEWNMCWQKAWIEMADEMSNIQRQKR